MASRPLLLHLSSLRLHMNLGEDTAGPVDPSWPKVYPIPCDIVLSKKSSRKEGRREDVQRYHHLSSQLMHNGALLSWEWLSTDRKLWMNSLFWFVHVDFPLSVKLFLFQSLSFLIFGLLILSPSHWRGVKGWLHGAELLTGNTSQQIGKLVKVWFIASLYIENWDLNRVSA